MERRRLIKPIAWILTLVMILSMFSGVTVFAATGTLTRNSATRHQVCTALSTKAKSYYTGSYTYANLSKLNGVYSPNDSWAAMQNNSLYNALKNLMSSTHTVYAEYNPSGETKTELSYLWDYTDACAGSSQYLYFYTDISADDYGTSSMQREHVWPESKASYFQTNGGSDLHHLRPSVGSVNSNKSNFAFANVREDYTDYKASTVDGQDVIWYKQTKTSPADGVIEVRDNIKGDVARILMYIWCRWGEPNLYSDVDESKCPTMDSKDNGDNQTGLRVIEDMETLLEWMELDPVDTWEMTRNDQAENFQGNRNVFIDYPELAWLVLGQNPPSDMLTPSGEALLGSDYTVTATTNDNLYGTVSVAGNVITAKPATGYYAAGYTVLSGTATVVQNGNTFTVRPSSDCIIRINFEASASVTLSFSVPEGVTQTAITTYAGNSVTLPKPSGSPKADAFTYSFVGWTDASVTDSETKPMVYTAGSSYKLNGNTTFYALYTYEDFGGDGYYLQVTNADQLVDGGNVVIVSATANYAMGTTQNANNRSQAAITKNSSTKTVSFTASAKVAEFILLRGDLNETYSFYDSVNKGYIYAASSSSNYLRTESTLSENSSFAITINTDGTATLKAQGSNSRNVIRHYSSNFSCYASTSTSTRAVCLYAETYDKVPYYTTVLRESCSHSYKTSTVAATCLTAGSVTYKCSKCGDSYTEAIPATGHSYSATTVNASTCTTAGQARYTCTACGDSYTEALPLLEHSYTSKVTKEATCTQSGERSYSCTNCSDSYTETIPMLDHSYINGICPVCGAQNSVPSYSLVTSVSDLTSGKYVIVVKAGGTYASNYPYSYYAMKGANSGNYLASAPADSFMGTSLPQTISVSDSSLVWTATVSGSYMSLTSSDGKSLTAASYGSSANLGSTATTWNFAYNATDKTVSLSVVYWSVLQYYFGLRDDSSTAGSNGLPVFSTSSSGSTSSYRFYFYKEVSGTVHKHVGTAVPAVSATCTQSGVKAHWTCACGKYFSDSACTKEITKADTVTPATGHSNGYVDNGNGTHDYVCKTCGTVATDNEKHSFANGSCICGAKESTEATLDSTLTFGAQLYLENDLTMAFRVKQDKLTNYDISTACLVVERDVYETGAAQATVETMTISEYKIEGGRLIFSYPGIAAAQMNDSIRATLHIKDASGKEYVGPVVSTSVAAYLDGLLTNSASDTKLVTLIMDMVNYGAAAQIYFDRHADALVNEAYQSFKTYASYASADFTNALENLATTEGADGKNGKLNLGLDLGTRIGIQYKVTVPADVNAEDVTLVITDAQGNELETLAVAGNATDSRGRYLVNFYGSSSRDMRRVVYATAYANGVAITGTYAYSISTYAWGIQENASVQPAELVTVTRAMMLYGDSATEYFK